MEKASSVRQLRLDVVAAEVITIFMSPCYDAVEAIMLLGRRIKTRVRRGKAAEHAIRMCGRQP